MTDNPGPKEGVPGKDFPVGMLTRAEAAGIIIESRREESRQQYDWFKHQTTLSTGSILVVLGLVGGVLDFHRFEWLLVCSLMCLVVSTLVAFYAMFWTFKAGGAEELSLADEAVSLTPAELEDSGALARIAQGQHILALVLGSLGAGIFGLAVVAFILFTLLNLFFAGH